MVPSPRELPSILLLDERQLCSKEIRSSNVCSGSGAVIPAALAKVQDQSAAVARSDHGMRPANPP